jgi:hypothetical protein
MRDRVRPWILIGFLLLTCLHIFIAWWFSPGTPASSITKTGHHDIAEILLKVALRHQKINHSINYSAPIWTRCRKYVINSLINGHFHIGLVIIHRPILALDCVSGQYGGLGMITRPITGYFPGVWKYGLFTSGHIGHTKMPLFELSM